MRINAKFNYSFSFNFDFINSSISAINSLLILLNSNLIILTDYEGIANSYYNRLSRLQKYVEKNLFSLEEVVDNVREEIRSLDVTDISEAQKTVIDKITTVVEQLEKTF